MIGQQPNLEAEEAEALEDNANEINKNVRASFSYIKCGYYLILSFIPCFISY